MPATFTCPVSTYQQFTPTEGEAWRREKLTFSKEHTAVVVMHATEPPPPNQFPGWHRAVPYLTKSAEVLREVFPSLLTVIRRANMPI